MNHRTHSGSSPTVITNPNAFDSSNSTKNSISASFPEIKRILQRSHPQNGASPSDHRPNGINTSTKNAHTVTVDDFDALESIPIDDVTTDDAQATAINVISQTTSTNHENSAHISAVFKKLTTYLSNASHKTLTNLKLSNHKNSQLNHLENNRPPLGFSRNQSSSDNCAVFENCNAIPVAVSSNGSECGDDTSPLPSDKQTPFVATHTKKPKNLHHSSDRISVSNKISLSANAMCRPDDSYALDGRATTIPISTMPSVTAQTTTTKRTKDLKSIQPTGETFSLPRVSLRQR